MKDMWRIKDRQKRAIQSFLEVIFLIMLLIAIAAAVFLRGFPEAEASKKTTILHGPAAVKCSFNRRKTCIEYGPNKHKQLLKKQIKAKGFAKSNENLKKELSNRDLQIKTLKTNAVVYSNRIKFAKEKEVSYLRMQGLDKKAIESQSKRVTTLEERNQKLMRGSNVWFKHPAFWTCVGIVAGIGLTIAIVQAAKPSTATSSRDLLLPHEKTSPRPSRVLYRAPVFIGKPAFSYQTP